MYNFFHETELILSLESILGERDTVVIVSVRVIVNWGSFVEIRRLRRARVLFLHVHIFT